MPGKQARLLRVSRRWSEHSFAGYIVELNPDKSYWKSCQQDENGLDDRTPLRIRLGHINELKSGIF